VLRDTCALTTAEEPTVLTCRSFRLVSSHTRVAMELREVCSNITMVTFC
jgi:hypothetical protein